MFNRIINADVCDGLRELPERSFHCVVTSPPYWGLRDYGIPPRSWADGTSSVYGLEATPELFVQHSVEIFREVRRVLRDDGVLFVNLGDKFSQSGKSGGASGIKNANSSNGNMPRTMNGGAAGSQLLNMPHRVAAALQADGWFWRSTIIWHKRNPMSESVAGWHWRQCRVKVGPGTFEPCQGCDKCRDSDGLVLRRGKWRPTSGHEYVFLMSKSDKYFCDGAAMQEPAVGDGRKSGMSAKYPPGTKNGRPKKESLCDARETRNPRTVWTFSGERYKGSHFAVFPTALARRCIEAGTSSGGCCAECGSPLAPITEKERIATRPGINNKIWKHQHTNDAIMQRSASSPNLDPRRHISITRTLGYLPTCNCNAAVVPCRVLDPFGGSGTTAQVARNLGRDWVICEINPAYCELAKERIAKPLTTVKSKKAARKRANDGQGVFAFGE